MVRSESLHSPYWMEADNETDLFIKANVMLSYPIPEALALLRSKLSSAEVSLSQAIEDLELLRSSITTCEVNTARLYNFDVKRRRERRLRAEAAGEGKEEEGDEEEEEEKEE